MNKPSLRQLLYQHWRIYVSRIVLASLILLSIAAIQHVLVLEIELADLNPQILIIPVLVGAAFGFLLTTVRLMQKEQVNQYLLLAEKEKALEDEIERREAADRGGQRLRYAIQGTNDGLWDWNITTDEVYYSPRWLEMLAFSPDQVEDHPAFWRELVHPEDADSAMANLEAHLQGETPHFLSEMRLRTGDGEWLWVLGRGQVVERDDQGHPLRAVGTMTDITDRKRMEDELQSNEERFRDYAESSSDWFWETDAEHRYTAITGQNAFSESWLKENIIGKKRVDAVLNPDELESEHWRRHLATLDAHQPVKNFEYLLNANGKPRWVSINGIPRFDAENNFIGYRGTGIDITERVESQEKIKHQASHDALTDLISRYEFERRAKRLLSGVAKEQSEHALCFLDLDQFKVVNDTCGHAAGDELLRQLGRLLKGLVRKRDTLARLGGDEFGVLMEHCSLEKAYRVANNILEAVKDYQFIWGGNTFRLGVSVGLVAINEKSGSFTEIFRQADAACYLAKDLGRNRIHTYHPDDTEMAIRHGELQWVGRINHALDENRFCLYAQPIVSLENAGHRHYELLVRMIDEQQAIIPPGAFLPAAERYNLIEKIDAWVVNHACSVLSQHPEFIEQTDFLSINLSGPSLTNEHFLESILQILEHSGLAPEKICFEVTESVAVSNLDSAIKFIQRLKDIGCHFALDDFGSGISSFGYLKNLPVDYLKIDGMFVRDIVRDPIDRAMVKSINEIGQVMGKKTIAEFVENKEIADMLAELGVNYGQGYGLGKPLPLVDLLAKNPS